MEVILKINQTFILVTFSDVLTKSVDFINRTALVLSQDRALASEHRPTTSYSYAKTLTAMSV